MTKENQGGAPVTEMGWPALAFGFAGIIINAIIFQQKSKHGLLQWKLTTDIVWTMHYILAGAYSGAAICLIAVSRGIIFLCREKHAWARSKAWLALFLAAALISPIVTWRGPFSLLPVLASVLCVVNYWIANPRLARLLVFPIGLSMMIYDIAIGSIPGIIGESMGIISSIVGIFRLDRGGRKEKE